MRKKKATVISFVHRKGGTAKSTSTLNLGAGLALAGKSVVLLDGDSLCRYRHNGSYPEDKVIPNFLE